MLGKDKIMPFQYQARRVRNGCDVTDDSMTNLTMKKKHWALLMPKSEKPYFIFCSKTCAYVPQKSRPSFLIYDFIFCSRSFNIVPQKSRPSFFVQNFIFCSTKCKISICETMTSYFVPQRKYCLLWNKKCNCGPKKEVLIFVEQY